MIMFVACFYLFILPGLGIVTSFTLKCVRLSVMNFQYFHCAVCFSGEDSISSGRKERRREFETRSRETNQDVGVCSPTGKVCHNESSSLVRYLLLVHCVIL